MTSFEKTMVVGYSQQQMYQLVADVASYPQFLPWCQRVEITGIDNNNKRVRIVLQHRGPMPLSITTRATFQPDNALFLQLTEGSFLSSFTGEWHFRQTGEHCHIRFSVRYRFTNRLLKLALSPFFALVVKMMPELFIQRAHKIYGYRSNRLNS